MKTINIAKQYIIIKLALNLEHILFIRHQSGCLIKNVIKFG